MTKKLPTTLLMACLTVATWLPLNAQGDNPSNLTELLVSKGILTSTEVNSLNTTDPATEKALVALLVDKGVISSAEADSLAMSSRSSMLASSSSAAGSTSSASPAPETESTLVKAKDKAVKTLTISGRIQGQWDVLSTSYDNAPDPDSENNLFLRRLYLGAEAKFADNLKGYINMDLGNGADGDAQLEKAVIEAGLSEHHTLTVGFQKVIFGYEEYTSSSKMKAVERSVGTRYFTEDFNARHAGVFFSGAYDSGLIFDLAVTNPEGNSVSASSGTDSLAYWGRLGWNGDIGDISVSTGVAGGYIPDIRVNGKADTVWNAYANLNTGPFNLLVEFLGATAEDAKLTGGDAQPITFTFLPSFQINDSFEVVLRYSQIDSDGGIGADISRVFRRAPENGSALYDDVQAYYIGGNWYIRGNTLKLSAGYEWAKFEDNLTGTQGDADGEGFRTRLQLLF